MEAAALTKGSWGAGDWKNARKQLVGASGDAHGGKAMGMPWASFGALTAPGPSGERYEHLQDCLAAKEYGPKMRLKRALDQLA